MTAESSGGATASSCPAVQRFTELLQEGPTEFDIAILSGEANENLEDAFVLQDGSFLGVNALDLPRLARDVRQDYWKSRKENSTLENVTKCLLLLCPDHATAWADRRRHLQRLNFTEQQVALREELAFLNLLMTKHTKSYVADVSLLSWMCVVSTYCSLSVFAARHRGLIESGYWSNCRCKEKSRLLTSRFERN